MKSAIDKQHAVIDAIGEQLVYVNNVQHYQEMNGETGERVKVYEKLAQAIWQALEYENEVMNDLLEADYES